MYAPQSAARTASGALRGRRRGALGSRRDGALGERLLFWLRCGGLEEIDEQAHADAGPSRRPVALGLVEIRCACDVQVRPRGRADEMPQEGRGGDGAAVLAA